MATDGATRRAIVITGSTRGIGLGMARAFLERGCSVCVSGRSAEALASALAELEPLAARHGSRVVGQPCDVADYAQVEALWAAAARAFGRVDVWINNAAQTNSRRPVGELPPQELRGIAEANLLGTLNASQVVVRELQRQPGGGFLYNFEGFGSNGMVSPGMSAYGASKAAVTYFTKCLVKETAGTPARVGYIMPGIVVTDLSMAAFDEDPVARARVARIYNILADTVDTVAPWLAERVLANDRHGARISWLTTPKAAGRFLGALFRKREVISAYRPGA
jgi:NAD(P)-dependent dehydrogenase (short-subunit alcohol dehydrogenase family)